MHKMAGDGSVGRVTVRRGLPLTHSQIQRKIPGPKGPGIFPCLLFDCQAAGAGVLKKTACTTQTASTTTPSAMRYQPKAVKVCRLT